MIRSVPWFVWLAIGATACGQDEISLADGACDAAACGEYYPGAADTESDDEDVTVAYGLGEGDISSCLIFPSVRQRDYAAPETKHLSFSELHLSFYLEEYSTLNPFFGLSQDAAPPRYLVFVTAAAHCPECASLISDLSENAEEVEAEGILSVAAGDKDLWRTEYGLSLEESEELLEADGWPINWLRTHDPTDEITSAIAAWPTVIGIRLKDMRILINDASVRTTDDLISILELRDEQLPVLDSP